MKTLRERLIFSPILLLARAKGQYIADTNACEKQIGTVLLQRELFRLSELIGRWSRSPAEAKSSYNTTGAMGLTVVWALLFLCSYLEGCRATACTDPSAFDGF